MSRLDKLIKTRDDAEAGTAKARTPHERYKHQRAYERAIRKMKGLEEKLNKGGKHGKDSSLQIGRGEEPSGDR